MKTLQIMDTADREFLGSNIRQRTDTYFLLSDLEIAGNKQRQLEGRKVVSINEYFRINSNKDFIAELERKIGKPAKISGRGRNSKTWIHPFLFIDIALWYSPKIKIEVYEWLYDYLIKYRVASGDSYTKMCGVLWEYASRKDLFQKNIKNLANVIKQECGVVDWNTATQEQLKDREYLHNMIADLAETLQNSHLGANLAIKAYRKKIGIDN